MQSLIVFGSFVAMSFRGRAQYPIPLVLALITSVLMFAAEFSLVYFLGSKVGAIHGWAPQELTILYVGTMLANSLQVAFTDSLRNLDYELLSGDLDLKLLRPVHPLVIMLGRVSVDAIAIPVFCIAVLALTIRQTIQYWTLWSVLWFCLSIVGGALIYSAIAICSSALAFWTYDSDSFYTIAKKSTRQLLWYPLDIYHLGLRLFLICLLPLAFIAYLPTHVIIGRAPQDLPRWVAFIGLPVGMVFFALSVLLWHLGLRRYHSTGA